MLISIHTQFELFWEYTQLHALNLHRSVGLPGHVLMLSNTLIPLMLNKGTLNCMTFE